MSQELIKKVLPFNEQDLELNRQGKVSASQLQRLKDEVAGLFRYGIIGIVTSAILFIIAAIAFSRIEYKKPAVGFISTLPQWLIVLVAFTVFILGVSLIIVLSSTSRINVYNGRLVVKVTEGKVVRFSPGFDDHSHQVKVGEVEFYVDEKTHDAFTGNFYRVYFLDSSDILSAEEIEH